MIKEKVENAVKRRIKKKIAKVVFVVIKPFTIPIIIVVIFIALITSITDILYIAFDNDDKIDMKKELAYYDTEYEREKNKEEVKGFFASVWDFTSKLFGDGGMSEETDWPVERTLYN